MSEGEGLAAHLPFFFVLAGMDKSYEPVRIIQNQSGAHNT
jgi:hypothetical protein